MTFVLSEVDYYDAWASTNDYLQMEIGTAGLGSPPPLAHACLVEFQAVTHTVFLASDAGGPPWAQGAVGSATPLSNSQCTIGLAGATATQNGNSFSATFQVTFAPGFTGPKEIWAVPAYNGTGTWYYAGSIAVAPVAVTVSPATAALCTSLTQQFTAAVANAGNTAVTWTASPAMGTIGPSGLYTAPASVGAQQEITLTATSVADTTRSATARVTLLPAAAWYSPAWTYRKPIAFDRTKVNTASGGTAPLAGFPALIAVTDADLRFTGSGGKVGSSRGNDIVFTASDGITPLGYEIEFYGAATGQLVAWVGIPNLSSTAGTVIWEYFGNAAAPPATAAGVQAAWDPSFMGIWHLATIW